MEDIRIYCGNTRTYDMVAMGTTLKEISERLCPAVKDKSGTETPVMAALVDNKL